MASNNFMCCLAITLKWEGGYSNHPDDPGGPTMRGIIQREYDAWRKKHGQRLRPVQQIEDDELQAIYRNNYWDAMGCEDLPAGFDLCVFDAAVNSGVGRATRWMDGVQGDDIEAYCELRLTFLQGLGRLWRVFGAGWRRRVVSIRIAARSMTGQMEPQPLDDECLHAGMKGAPVLALQEKLRALGYPTGALDGIFGEQTYRAVVLFQHDHDLAGDPGVWLLSYNGVLSNAAPMLPRRREATRRDLEAAGDRPIQRMNFLQRIFAWLFGGAATAEVFSGSSMLDSVSGIRAVFEPLQDIWDWALVHRWLFLCAVFVAVIGLIRMLREEHVKAYQNFDYQGPQGGQLTSQKTEPLS